MVAEVFLHGRRLVTWTDRDVTANGRNPVLTPKPWEEPFRPRDGDEGGSRPGGPYDGDRGIRTEDRGPGGREERVAGPLGVPRPRRQGLGRSGRLADQADHQDGQRTPAREVRSPGPAHGEGGRRGR